MPHKDIDRLPPDQLMEEVGKKGARANVADADVREEARKRRETSPTGAPKECQPKAS